MSSSASRSVVSRLLRPSPSSDSAPETKSLFSPEFVRLLLVQFLFGLSFSTFLLLPKFLRLELHASASEIGRVSASGTIVAAAFAPFVGGLVRRMARRKVLAVALAAEALGAFAMCTVHQTGPLLYVYRGLQGAAWVMVFNVTATWAADLAPEGRMAQSIGYLGGAMLITNAIAPGVAEPLAHRFGYPPVFAGAGLLVAASSLMLLSLKEPRVVQATQDDQPGITGPFLGGRVVAVLYCSLLLGAGIGSMFTYVQPFAIERGTQLVGPFFFGYVASAIFVRTALSGLPDRVGAVRVAVAAFGLYALTVALTGYLDPSLLVVYGIGLGTSHGFGYPALTAAGFNTVGKAGRNQFMSWYTFTFNVGYALTVLTLGPVVDTYGYTPLFVAVGLSISTGALALLYAFRSTSLARSSLAASPTPSCSEGG